MESYPYINIHTHDKSIREGEVSCISYFHAENEISWPSCFCIGMHPWHAKIGELDCCLPHLESVLVENSNAWLGEIGLDRTVDVEFEMQKTVFEKQLKLAERLQRPVVIHCVKAYSDVLQCLKKMKFSLPLIFHGYSGNLVQAKQLLAFDAYFSFGQNILRENRKSIKVLKELPLERVFFETDEAEFSIYKVYEKAAEIVACDEDFLKNKIAENFKRLQAKEF